MARKAQPPILCDWCDGVAISSMTRGERTSRRFFCDLHRADYDRDLSDWWAKPTLPGRDRFIGLDIDTVEACVNRQARRARGG
jgi:hypothetical protein